MNSRYEVISLASVLIIFSLIYPCLSLFNDQKIISTSGTITRQKPSVVAKSGHAKDIQAAIDTIAPFGTGIVYIPEGVWNFYEVGEEWVRVNVPAGIDIIGAGLHDNNLVFDETNQTSNWETVLRMPFEAPNRSIFFLVKGDPSKPYFRFAYIAIVGYREINQSSISYYVPLVTYNLFDFRIDHNLFQNTGFGAKILSDSNVNKTRGVVDHNKFINTAGGWQYPNPGATSIGDVYAINYAPGGYWEPNIDSILGKYNDNTLFVEDNYFQRWRHINGNNNAHIVFRHNVYNSDSASGSVNAHDANEAGKLGCRMIEAYDNQFLDPYRNGDAFRMRSGAGVIYNNYIRGYYTAVQLLRREQTPICVLKDLYIWGNTLENVTRLVYNPNGFVEGIDYFLSEKSYTPYPYPHPLVSGSAIFETN